VTGAVRVPVEPHVVAWRVPVSGPFGAVDRCTDRELCRVRVRENGEEWPILETAERSA
jgi:hypothetical protein